MGIDLHFQVEAYARGFRFPAFYHGNTLGDDDRHYMDIARVSVYGYFPDRKFPSLCEEDRFSGFGYFSGTAFGGVRGMGYFSGRTLDFRKISPSFCGIFHRIFYAGGRYYPGDYDPASVDQPVCGAVFFRTEGIPRGFAVAGGYPLADDEKGAFAEDFSRYRGGGDACHFQSYGGNHRRADGVWKYRAAAYLPVRRLLSPACADCQ